jgi:hypothetical protein
VFSPVKELIFLKKNGSLLDFDSTLPKLTGQFLDDPLEELDEDFQLASIGHVLPPTLKTLRHLLTVDNQLSKEQFEGVIVQRYHQILELGTWSAKRLPKILEPRRLLCHWDYLLLEMKWMSTYNIL